MTILPNFQAASFSDPTHIDNVYFPLPAGAINSYGAEVVDPETGEENTERNDHFATFQTRTIAGIEAVVVRDTAFEDGVLVEDTLDWYAQDDARNVWYLGEIATNYTYDDDGAFLGTNFEGSWEAGIDGAAPGWIMRAAPRIGDSYYQEFHEGVAEDEGAVVAAGLQVQTGLGPFHDVLKIRDTSAFEPGVGAYKYFAPGVGQILEEEFAQGEPSLFIELENRRQVQTATPVDPADLAFAGSGGSKTITFLGEDGGANNAVGAYVFDAATGAIGEARILFAETEEARVGARASLTVMAGQSLGLFLIPNVEEIGLELDAYRQGGLFFRNPAAGDVADLYDGDGATTYTPGPATIFDDVAPVVVDAAGALLPIRAYHAVGDRDGFNFLNPVAGENARRFPETLAGVGAVAFEDGLASRPQAEEEDGGYNGDFDDAFVAVSEETLTDGQVADLLDATRIRRILGTDGSDRLVGTDQAEQLIARDGDDRVRAGAGADVVEAGDGDDCVRGDQGADRLAGEEGDDRLSGGGGADEIEGGEGRDRICGGLGADEIEGDEGRDLLRGGAGHDEIEGGEGRDILQAGRDGATMSGGAGDDVLIGWNGAADVFAFDLIPFGDDRITRFEPGSDRIRIADYLEVECFDDIEVAQRGATTVLRFAEGVVRLDDLDASLIDATDFVFA